MEGSWMAPHSGDVLYQGLKITNKAPDADEIELSLELVGHDPIMVPVTVTVSRLESGAVVVNITDNEEGIQRTYTLGRQGYSEKL